MMVRRKFLGALLAAPMAAPVVAKEAAVAMGLSGPLNAAGAMLPGNMLSAGTGGCNPSEPGSYLDFLRSQLAGIVSGKPDKEIEREARYAASRLDPDLAAMRSASPAFVWQAQRERTYNRIIEDRKASLLEQIARETKGTLGL